tara:strand:- start:3877 stop:4725 length:849 start_codon:yes stop_codon:yes gene_type:complete
MEIVNESFPRGNKFYPVCEQHREKASKVFSLEMHNAAKFMAENSPKRSGVLSKAGCDTFMRTFDLVSQDTFPKFRVKCYSFFRCLSEHVSIQLRQRKDYYQSMQRFDQVAHNMPWYKDMIVQWDNVRKGFIVHDTPYEGEMVTVPKSGISKAITEQLKDIVAETGMFEILGENLYVGAGANLDSVRGDIEFYNSFEYLLNGTQTHDQTCKVALLSGAYFTKYCNDKSLALSHLPYGDPNRHKYYKLVKTKSKPKISTVTRQKLLFKYGGTRLPDNYMDWFDG